MADVRGGVAEADGTKPQEPRGALPFLPLPDTLSVGPGVPKTLFLDLKEKKTHPKSPNKPELILLIQLQNVALYSGISQNQCTPRWPRHQTAHTVSLGSSRAGAHTGPCAPGQLFLASGCRPACSGATVTVGTKEQRLQPSLPSGNLALEVRRGVYVCAGKRKKEKERGVCVCLCVCTHIYERKRGMCVLDRQADR